MPYSPFIKWRGMLQWKMQDIYGIQLMMQHSFIHSLSPFSSASSSPFLLRSAPNTARILCRSFTPKRHRPNHNTSTSSIRQPPGLPLKIKMSSLQTLLPRSIRSFTLPISSTPTLTATPSPPGILETGPELLLTSPLETPL